MRLLVTGVSGLVGRHVEAAAHADQAIDLVVTGRTRPNNLAKCIEFVAADLSDGDEAARVVRDVRPTHLIHAAWETRHPTYYHDLANLDWVIATARMAVEFAAGGGKRFVQVGSCAEYDWTAGRCVEGVTPDRPATRYGAAKLAAFRAVEAAAMDQFEAVEARIFWVFGPHENPQRLIPLICQSHLRGVVPMLGSGTQLRDLVYGPDAARALLALTRADGLEGVVNIGSGEPVSLSSVAILLAGLAGVAESGLGLRPDLDGGPALLSASDSRLRSTGWSPEWKLNEALAQTYQWWRSQNEGAPSHAL